LEKQIEVGIVCPFDKYVSELEQLGARWIDWPLNRRSMSPLAEAAAVRLLRRIYVAERPDLIHHFTVKPILYGTLAAKRADVPRIVNSVTGLGYAFTIPNVLPRWIQFILEYWYSWSVAGPGVRSIYQNTDDVAHLSAMRPLTSAYASLANGSGVDIQRFAPDIDATDSPRKRPCVLFAGRLLYGKGIREFVQAAQLLRDRGSAARFVVCGSPDPGNPSSANCIELEQWRREGVVEFVGHVEQMETRLKGVDIFALPSYYREGQPRSLIEAAAAGKPSVTCDVAGCRDVVVSGRTGLVIPPRDTLALANAIQSLLDDGQMRKAMGLAARQRAVEMYDERQVVSQIINVYSELSSSHDPQADDRRATSISKGVFLFSLDLEGAWGTRSRPAARHIGPWLDGERPAIRGLLDLFAKYRIPATWAIVGALLLGRNRKTRHPWLSSDEFSDVPAGDSATAPAWFAEDVLESILECPVVQEIACHTLTHQIVAPGSDGHRSFAQDLQRFRELADEFSLKQPGTFIFPRHVMAHFDVLAQNGFTCIRGPIEDWFERLPGKATRAGLRLIDAVLARPPRVGLPRRLPCGLWQLPPSQFYSPLMSVGKHVSVEARVRKAVKGLRMAAKRSAIFHLWTHPFNLGVGTEELVRGLDTILAEARRLADAGEIEITTMGELAARLEQQRRKRLGRAASSHSDQ
jgi:glycosyltransferase involved in cell wall biosynthesis